MYVSNCVFRRVGRLAVVLVVLAAPALATAMAAMPRVFSDNMVLQREKPIPVWGKGDAGEEITVTLADKTATAKVGAGGRWTAWLPAMPAGGPHTLAIKGAKGSASFKNVMIGEVWVCSGQSNMAWTVKNSDDADKEIAAANHPNIRLITFMTKTAVSPAQDVETGGWQVCNPQTIPNFSAVAYYYGRELNSKLDVPIGLINTSWGGSAIEPWTPPVGFARTPKVSQFVDKIDEADQVYIKSLSEYIKQRQAYLKKAAGASAAEAGKIERPLPPQHPWAAVNGTPSVIYNAMIDPILPYAIAGAIWYQGEANCVGGDGLLYTEKMRALIDGWRTVWNQGDFPFYYVQIAPWDYASYYPGTPDRLPLIWQAQTNALAIPNTGMAVVHDVGNLKNIHPTNKQEVGRRLALWALAKTYGHKDLVCSGPLYKSMTIEGSKIRVAFDSIGGGLASRDGKPLNWFQIAGEDKKFVDATATVEGVNLVVASNQVAKPVAVRFAWNELAEPNLMNKEGLPASPFRTDAW